MSRSKRKTPISSIRCSPQRLSEKTDKALCSRRMRRKANEVLHTGGEEPPDDKKEFGDRWNFKKDGCLWIKKEWRDWKAMRK